MPCRGSGLRLGRCTPADRLVNLGDIAARTVHFPAVSGNSCFVKLRRGRAGGFGCVAPAAGYRSCATSDEYFALCNFWRRARLERLDADALWGQGASGGSVRQSCAIPDPNRCGKGLQPRSRCVLHQTGLFETLSRTNATPLLRPVPNPLAIVDEAGLGDEGAVLTLPGHL